MKVTSADIIITILISTLSMAVLLFILLTSGTGSELIITSPSGTWIYSLSEDRTVSIPGALGNTVIEIRDKKFRFLSSTCPDKICVHAGFIASPLIPVVCLPNQVTAVIHNPKKTLNTIDGVAR